MKAIIIDDEEMAIKVIQSHLEKLGDVEVIASFQSAGEALLAVQKNEADVIFLDIEMPGLSGMQLLKSLKQRPKVIITTAYREYAIDGYEFNISDYLLKPISFERIAQALAKVSHQINLERGNNGTTAITKEEPATDFIYVRSERENVKIHLSDILYIESLKNHVKISTTEGNIITLISISKILEKLPVDKFQRIHKSFIVAIEKIQKYTQYHVHIGENALPVGKMHKREFLKVMEGYTI